MAYSFTFGVIFIVSGILFFSGKALNWVKGWQTMPEEEKAKIRVVPLCRNIAVMLILAGAVFLAAGFQEAFREGMFRWVMIGWLVLCGLDLVFIEKSGRYVVKQKQIGRK